MFVVRRLIFVAIAIFVNETLFFQLFLLITIQLCNLGYQGAFKPGPEQFINRLDCFNEFMILICSETMIFFTDFIPSLDLQLDLGWLWISLVVLTVLVNLLIIIYHSLRSVFLILKKYGKRAMAMYKEYQNYINFEIM